MNILLHIILILILGLMSTLQHHDHHQVLGDDEKRFTSCEAEEHNHSEQSSVHNCILVRRNQLSEYLIPAPYIQKIDPIIKFFFNKKQMLCENHFASLFDERSPPA